MENEIEISARSEADYVITRRWLSDVEFFKVEATFLHRLQQDYFIRSDDQPTIEKLKVIGHQLLRLHEDMISADVQLNSQLKNIAAVAENEIPENVKNLTVNQLALGHLMTNLIDEYREVKKELFTLVESIMREAA
jgi:hypothetical protein